MPMTVRPASDRLPRFGVSWRAAALARRAVASACKGRANYLKPKEIWKIAERPRRFSVLT